MVAGTAGVVSVFASGFLTLYRPKEATLQGIQAAAQLETTRNLLATGQLDVPGATLEVNKIINEHKFLANPIIWKE